MAAVPAKDLVSSKPRLLGFVVDQGIAKFKANTIQKRDVGVRKEAFHNRTAYNRNDR